MTFTHLDEQANPKMVPIETKTNTQRQATARCQMQFPPGLLAKLRGEHGSLVSKKGSVIHTAIVAGTMAVKRTADLIPFCHQLPLESCHIHIQPIDEDTLEITCQVGTTYKTGVEMEALVGANIAALTVYDMCKSGGHGITINQCCLVEKRGGKADWSAPAGKPC